MARPAHPHAMRASGPERTRTAPPQMPQKFPWSGRYRNYVLFDATGFIYLLVSFVALRAIWALGNGEAAWKSMQEQLSHWAYVSFHIVTLVSVCFVAVRFFSLFPKAQPPRIGPVKTPPAIVFTLGLYAAWIGITAAMSAILAGGIF